MESDPAADADIAKVANQVLKQRLQALHADTPAGNPLRISLNTRQKVGHVPGTALTIDWSHRFGGVQNRQATAADWREKLLPALADVRDAIQQYIPHRRLVVNGLACLPAATALGHHFMATAGTDIAWEQRMPDGNSQAWSIGAAAEDCGFSASVIDGDLDAADLAVLVSVNNDVSQAVAASAAGTGPFRAYVHLKRADSAAGAFLNTPGQAVDLARKNHRGGTQSSHRIRNTRPSTPFRGCSGRFGNAHRPTVKHARANPDLRTHPDRLHRPVCAGGPARLTRRGRLHGGCRNRDSCD